MFTRNAILIYPNFFFLNGEKINCFASPKKIFPFLSLLSLFFLHGLLKEKTNKKYIQWPNMGVLDNHHFFSTKYICNIAHMQLLSKEYSSTPSLGCPDNNMTNIVFLDKSILKFLKNKKVDGDHCQFSDLLCLLIMVPMFTLNYCCFSLLEILFGLQK